MPVLTLTNPGGLDQRSRVPQNLVCEAENLGLAHDGWMVMRPGAGPEDYTGSGFTGPIQWLGRFVTTAGVQELWGTAENGGTTAALARKSGGSWNPVSYSDTVNVTNLRYHHGATLNGKFFFAYDSDVNRLHVWDGTTLRRVGLIIATAPSVAEQGAGSLSFTRHYRQRNVVQVSGVTVRRSEASTSVSITIASKLGVTVTKGAASNDGETHWEVEASDTGAVWYRIATVAVGTSTYSDTAASIPTTNLTQLAGLNIPPPSAKFIVSDGNRLLMAGAWESSAGTGETTPLQNRVWFTRVLGSTDIGDDETIPNTLLQQNFIDVGDGAAITALSEPIYGEIYVCKSNSIWKLSPTGDSTTPYRAVIVSAFHSAISQRCVVSGTGPDGGPAIYFASTNAVYRIAGGIQEISAPIARDLRGSAFTLEGSFIGFDPAQQELIVNVSTGAPAFYGAYEQFGFDTRSGRWTGLNLGGSLSGWILGVSTLGITTVLGESGAFLRAAVAAEASDGITRLFLGGQDLAQASALVSWGSALGADMDNPFSCSVRWRGLIAEGRNASIKNPVVVYRNPIGDAGTAAILTLTYYREDGTSRSQSKTLAAQDANDPLSIRSTVFEGLEMADCYVLDFRATLSYTNGFTGEVWPGIDCIQFPYKVQEVKAA